ncbi:MAG TPA: M14 metallopeptidase family protein [Candidatus Dormibacteraeota bacterium]|nr:M14 metallopeptidase family protein [Candidatus Dormibacteraeota bacterium]
MKMTGLTTRLLAAALLAWGAAALAAQVPAAAQVPSPDSFLGFKVGEDRKLADWEQVVGYFQRVAAAAPERVKFAEIGKSTLGKPFVALTISSAENLKKLDRYLQIQQRLADPRGLAEPEAEKLIAEGKAVVLITCTVHSTEVASTQTAMEYVYKLLAEDTPGHRAILDNVIFLLIPSLNPDGQDMVVKWYRKYLGTPFEGSAPVELYHPYVGHDNNRDWYMFTQIESQLTVGKVQNVWHPQVVYDVHQMGSYSARIFTPPFLDPVDPNVDPLIVEETNMLGTSMAAALGTAGKKGVAINAMYDFWTPGRHYQSYHAGLRILTESASARLASPIRVRAEELDTASLGYNAQRSSWNYPDPWKGGEWHLRDIVDYQLIAFDSCLGTVAQNREMFLRTFTQIGRKAIERKGPPFAYIFPPEQKDSAAAVKLLNTLRFGLVEVERARDRFTADGIEYPAGTYVILLAQPYGSYAKTLLERQNYPDLREYPGGPPKRPYDVTAQTLPLLMGVTAVAAQAPFQASLEKIDKVVLAAGKVEPARKQYLLRADSNNAYLAVNRLLKSGAAVARLKSAVRDAGREFPAGTFVIRSGSVRELAPLGCDFSASDAVLSDATPLRAPRVALYKSYVPSMDEGWTRWLLEQFEFPYTSVYDKDIREAKLESRFDVIVIPDQSVSSLVNGNPKLQPAEPTGTGRESRTAPRETGFFQGPVPDEFTGGIGAAGVANLRAFVMQGGTLVTLNNASNFPIERMDLGARNVLRDVTNREFYGPGSILRIAVNPNHPIGYGMEPEAAAWFEHGPVFAPAFQSAAAPGAGAVASYPNGNPLMSGWLLGEGLLQNRSAVMDAPLGRGHVVLFGFRPQYRGQSYGTFKMLFNALYYFRQ